MVKRARETERAWYVMVQPGAPQECHPVTVYTVVAVSAEHAVKNIMAVIGNGVRVIAVVTDFTVIATTGAYGAFSSIESNELGGKNERA